jgi:zinc-ribbon domain
VNCTQCGAQLRDAAMFCDQCGFNLGGGEESQWDTCQVVEAFRRGRWADPDLYGYKAEAQGPTGTYPVAATRMVPAEQRDSVLEELTEQLVRDGWEHTGTPQEGIRMRFRRLSRLRPTADS